MPSLSLSPFRPCRSPSDLLSPFLRAGRPPLLARLACPCHAMLMDGATGGRPGFFLSLRRVVPASSAVQSMATSQRTGAAESIPIPKKKKVEKPAAAVSTKATRLQWHLGLGLCALVACVSLEHRDRRWHEMGARGQAANPQSKTSIACG